MRRSVLMAVVVFVLPVAIAHGELLQNPGFESGTSSWLWYHGGSSSVAPSTEYAHEGTHSAKSILTNANDWALMCQSVTVTSGNAYELSLWALPDSVTGSLQGGLKLEFYDNTGKNLSTSTTMFIDSTSTNDAWKHEVIQVTAPTGAVSFTFGAVAAAGSNGAGAIYFDDASVSPIPEPNTGMLLGGAMISVILARAWFKRKSIEVIDERG